MEAGFLEENVQRAQRVNRLGALLWLVGLGVAFFAVSFAAELAARTLRLSPLAGTSLFQLSILLTTVIFALADGGGFRSLGLTARWKWIDLAAIPGLALAHFFLSIVVAVVLYAAGALNTESANTANKVFSDFGNMGSNALLVSFVLAVQAGIGEELLFRGYIITRLERLGLKAWWCIILSALIFGAVHISGYGWAMALPKAAAMGLASGAYFWYRRNLWPGILAHFLVDFSMFALVILLMKLHVPL